MAVSERECFNNFKCKNRFINFERAYNDFNPECLKGKHWELIRLDLEDFIEKQN